MWPLGNRKSVPEINHRKLAYEKMKAFRGIGEKFNYLGVEMIVTGYSEILQSPFGFHYYPTLICDYRDQFGKINEIKFSPCKIDVLIRESR